MNFLESMILEAEELMNRNYEIQSWEELNEKDLDRVLYFSNHVFCECTPKSDDQFKRIKAFLAWDSSLGGNEDDF